MKKIIIFIIICVFVFTGAKKIDLASAQETLVPNPSLEQAASGNRPQSWNQGYWGNNSPDFIYLETGHTGTRSVKVEMQNFTDGDAKWYFDYQPITGGQYYMVSDYYKSNVETSVYLSVNKSNGTTENYLMTNAPAASDWTRYSDTILVPEEAISCTIFHVIAADGWLVTDDYSIDVVEISSFDRGLVSIVFDDGHKSVYKNALPLLNKYALKTTQFIISETLTNPDDYYMSTRQLQKLYASGHEIGSHSVTHPYLTNLTQEGLTYELSESKSTLNNLFPSVVNFASPYGDYNDLVLKEIKKYYNSHRSTEQGYNNITDFDPYNIKIQYVLKNVSIDTLNHWISQAEQDKSWLVLLYHYIDYRNNDYSITPQIFKNHLDIITNSNLAVVTMEEALNEIASQLSD